MRIAFFILLLPILAISQKPEPLNVPETTFIQGPDTSDYNVEMRGIFSAIASIVDVIKMISPEKTDEIRKVEAEKDLWKGYLDLKKQYKKGDLNEDEFNYFKHRYFTIKLD